MFLVSVQLLKNEVASRLGSKLLNQLRLDVIQAGCFAVLQYSDADVEFLCNKCSRESRVVRVPMPVEAYFRLSVRCSSVK